MTVAERVTELIRPATDFERELIRWVVGDDEYRIGGRRFAEDDVVVDVGAHIGTFSAMCHVLGSRSIRAFEPDPASLPRLMDLGRRVAGIQVDGRAVFRSDGQISAPGLVSSGGIDDNTGSSNVLFDGQTFDVDEQLLATTRDRDVARAVETVPLDEILGSIDRVSLLKLDCEGSEYPILLTSRLLGNVDEIVGEYHVISAATAEHMTPAARLGGLRSYGPGLIVVRLEAAGFDVTLQNVHPRIGLFRAVRRGATKG